MAREHAQVKLSIWDDDDFLALSPAAQHLYFVLMTSETLSYCGVADWRPKRIAKKATSWTAEAVEAAGAELERGLFVVVDEDTDEVLLRSWVRHDGLMARERMGVAMARAWSLVTSRTLRGVIVHEVKRYHEAEPALAGWNKIEDLLSRDAIDPRELAPSMPLLMALPEPSTTASTTPLAEQTAMPFATASAMDPPTPFSLLLAPSSPLQTPSSAEDPAPAGAGADAPELKPEAYSEAFEAAWAAYERRGAKRAAWAEWRRAIKRATPETITAAIPRYFAANRDPQYRLHFERYLKGDVWESVPAGADSGEVLPLHHHRDPTTGRRIER